jgi:hypothetical protein
MKEGNFNNKDYPLVFQAQFKFKWPSCIIQPMSNYYPLFEGVAVAAGAGASDSTLQNWKAQVVNLKRENTEANAKIKQLETELKKGRPGTGAATDDVSSRHCQNPAATATPLP